MILKAIGLILGMGMAILIVLAICVATKLIRETGVLGTGTEIAAKPLPRETTTHAGPTIDQVRALASLVTTKVEISDVIVTKLEGYTGGVEAAVLLRGDFELGVDLSAAKFDGLNEMAHTVVLVLPQPRVSQPRVDHQRSRIVAVQDKGLWVIVPGNDPQVAVTNIAFRDAQSFVEQTANDPAMVDRSRHQAEAVLGSFFKALGWSVTVRWLKD